MLANERLKHWLKLSVAIGGSVFFTALFVGSIDVREVGRALAGADYAYVAPALVLFAVSLVFRGVRWSLLFQPQPRLSWARLMPSLLVGYAGNNLLPLRAGELLRAQHLSTRESVPRMHTFGTLMMERLFDGLVLATFVLWGILLVDVSAAYLGVGLALAGATAAGFVVCIVLANRPDLIERVTRLPIPFVSARVREAVAGLGESFLNGFSVLRSPSRFGLVSLASMAAWGFELGMYWLLSQAFDLHASFITIAAAGAAANVALSLPSAQGGVGPFQYVATQALVRFALPADAAGAYALALHIFLVVPVSLVGLVVLWRTALRRKSEGAVEIASENELRVAPPRVGPDVVDEVAH